MRKIDPSDLYPKKSSNVDVAVPPINLGIINIRRDAKAKLLFFKIVLASLKIAQKNKNLKIMYEMKKTTSIFISFEMYPKIG